MRNVLKPIIALYLVLLLALAVPAAAGTTTTAPQTRDGGFPAVGHTYRVDFGAGNAFDIAFGSDHEMTFTKLQTPNQGVKETIQFKHRKIRDGVYLVYWQEADKSTVVHLEDFAEGIIYTNITSPSGGFYHGESKLTLLH